MALIDRDALIEFMMPYLHADEMVEPEVIIQDIMCQRIVDAEPVRHGRWEYPDYYDYGDICSYCGFDSGEIVGENQLKLLKYCPHCGAKMDEVMNDENK